VLKNSFLTAVSIGISLGVVYVGVYMFAGNIFLQLALVALLLAVPLFLFVLRNPERGILMMTFLLPFEQIGGIEIGGVNVRLSQLVFVITFVAWIVSGLYKKELFLKIDTKLFLLIFFLIISLISFQNTLNLFRSIQIFVFIAFVFAVYFFMSSFEFSRGLLKKIVYFLLISMVITTLFGVFQFAGDMFGLPTSITGLEEHYTKAVFGFPRIQSTANEPLNFANYLLLPLSILGAVFFSDNIKQKAKKLYDLKFMSLPLLVLGGIVLILTYSRGGWGGMALAFVIIALVNFRKVLKPKQIALGILGIMVLALGVHYFSVVTGAPFTLDAFVSRLNISDFSAAHRVQTTNQGLEAWEQSPILGIGLGSFGPLVAQHTDIEPVGGWQTVNNEYAELLIETGIFGFGSMALFWGIMFVQSIVRYFSDEERFRSIVLLGMTAALAGMLLQYISFSTLYVFHIWFMIGLMNNNFFKPKNNVVD